MPKILRLSLAQTTSAKTHSENIEHLSHIVKDAARAGANMLALPEVVGMMNKDFEEARKSVTSATQDPFIRACQHHAKAHKMWIQTGSTPVAGSGNKFRNHATLIDPTGKVVASYDKMHLFDVFLEGRPPTGESERYIAGDRAVLVETPFGPFGMTICYDLRFPMLYRDLAQQGAVLTFAPSAFTVPTGKAHWEILLRARAIENGMWIVAAAQVGTHQDGRKTWGHSMVVSPWGEVVADLGGKEAGLVTVDIDLESPAKARRQIPSLRNEISYTFDRIDLTK